MLDKGLLTEFSIFSDVPQDKLSAIAQTGDLVEFKPQEVIFHQDEAAGNLYGVLDGEVELILIFKGEVFKTDIQYEESVHTQVEVQERPIVIDTVGPGEVFGWSSLVNPRRLTATAKCSKPTQVFSIPAADFKSMLDQDPELGYVIMERLAGIISLRLQNRTDRLIESWGEAFEVDKI